VSGATPHLALDRLTRRFSEARAAVDAVSLEIAAGELVALIGASGSGKTTTLRMVAGYEAPDAGAVVLDGRDITSLPPQRRQFGMVFQHYALFPHLTVGQNVAFGLEARGVTRSERMSRAAEALAGVGLAGAAGRPIQSLSGGEQQRVALARALVIEPPVLLLDEPLSALDAHTKVAVRAELHELLATLDIPVLLVTHDFEDAAALANGVSVIVDGRLRQTGTPSQLVAAPADSFVASFTGANLLHGQAEPGRDRSTRVRLDDGTLVATAEPAHGRVALAVYPWDVTVGLTPPHDSALNVVHAPIRNIVELGNRVRLTVGPVSAEITAESLGRLGLEPGRVVYASFKATGIRVVAEHEVTAAERASPGAGPALAP